MVAEDLNTFEIHGLERTAVGMKEAEDEPVTRIECLSEEEKIEWVRAINVDYLATSYMMIVNTNLFIIRGLVIFVGQKAKCCHSVRDIRDINISLS